MTQDELTREWRALTPAQQAMLRRLDREGSLLSLAPWEMRTVRSLLERGLVRPRRPGRADVGLWFLSAKGLRILPTATGTETAVARTTSLPRGRSAHPAPRCE
ncbi:MAG: hypothetical protein INR63_09135 [Actinomycetospora chiangmaiensis]|jgi:hypothetical protein|nr:hypothetical protein [Actinomycetospora chiangmaiensis]